ncbi:MAG: hypothetical protein ACLFRX_10495 [Gemmatimonadota bacterium]
MTRVMVGAAVVGLASACGLGTSPEVEVGLVGSIQAPDTVQVGEAFLVTVTTSGPTACWSAERTEVSVTGLGATIVPYDRHVEGYCPTEVVEIAHTAELVFDQTGIGVLEVVGRDGTGGEMDIAVE